MRAAAIIYQYTHCFYGFPRVAHRKIKPDISRGPSPQGEGNKFFSPYLLQTYFSRDRFAALNINNSCGAAHLNYAQYCGLGREMVQFKTPPQQHFCVAAAPSSCYVCAWVSLNFKNDGHFSRLMKRCNEHKSGRVAALFQKRRWENEFFFNSALHVFICSSPGKNGRINYNLVTNWRNPLWRRASGKQAGEHDTHCAATHVWKAAIYFSCKGKRPI